MECLSTCEMLDLQPARKARGDDDGVWFGPAQGWQQTLVRDQLADVVMFDLVPERTRHAAAAGLQIDHVRAGMRRKTFKAGPLPTRAA